MKTNVLGTENVFEAASTCGAKRVVVLSTNKAVYHTLQSHYLYQSSIFGAVQAKWRP